MPTTSILFTAFSGIIVLLAVSYYVLLPVALRQIGAYLLRRTTPKRTAIFESLGAGADGRIVGFFHPYCNAGGGGERVLWAAIEAVQKKYPHVMSVVYTGDEAAPSDILSRAETRFSIPLDHSRITFVYLTTRHYVDAATWPHFTLAGQSLGSLFLAYDAFQQLVPDVFIDTMGYAFSVALAKSLFAIPTGAYVHYPTISTDMLSSLPGASLRTKIKRTYWKLFATAYSRCGAYVDEVMVNSSWTAAHVRSLWKRNVAVVFPPCAVTPLLQLPLEGREKVLLCIAQFRPEKDHAMLIAAFARFWNSTEKHKDAKLVLVGSVRHEEDAARVQLLRDQAKQLGVSERVEFVTDAPWPDVEKWLGKAWVGVNAMWNEHFGIGVVEYQAAGLIGVVHNSGGPKIDIVIPGTGFHAKDEKEFAEGFEKALGLGEDEVMEMRKAAKESAKRFDETTFEKGWLVAFDALMKLEKGSH
ncbi:hypothetical protein BZA77DRAFT_149987 [Pyronema omphalodes]|nr:hypothetical protein BZA77DRAFT_149987 [Pyronema omphalodes]